MSDFYLDVPSEIPDFPVRIDGEEKAKLTVADIYRLSMVNAESGKPLSDRLEDITEQFNLEFKTDINENTMYLIIVKGLEILDSYVKN